MNHAIEVEGLCRDFKDFRLKDVTFALPEGRIMGFVGKNGAGKTTTIRLILNMLARKSGTVRVFGLDNIADEQRIKQDIGVVFDDIFFVDRWSILEVEKAISGFYKAWDTGLFRKQLDRFSLPPEKMVKDLSRGMKMKLMLAVALSHEARLLILDEPTSGLDPVARDELLDILGEYVSDAKKSILFSTHITTDLEKIADHITLIDNGRIFYTGTKDCLTDRFRIVRGSPEDADDVLRAKMIGFSEGRTGFAGLMEAQDAKQIPEGMTAEAAAIDEILVYISKEDERK